MSSNGHKYNPTYSSQWVKERLKPQLIYEKINTVKLPKITSPTKLDNRDQHIDVINSPIQKNSKIIEPKLSSINKENNLNHFSTTENLQATKQLSYDPCPTQKQPEKFQLNPRYMEDPIVKYSLVKSSNFNRYDKQNFKTIMNQNRLGFANEKQLLKDLADKKMVSINANIGKYLKNMNSVQF